ncbi:hypothetical protein SeMB42_g03759 [Synchytrium endobioticum]|uniref:Uncharacterized protein n=1 Tax=Synchytrium endobioticum TaxID=286115 RepID=A0A507D4R0_9FUNG|nr:hypothetical protein SeLEV6574_g05331 [Synchytrium endobioticum]TPX46311.1 hypothetical protein SeMB42_g03759 [Synchytrium endobioticum]
MSKLLAIFLLLVACNQVVSTDLHTLRDAETRANNMAEVMRERMRVHAFPHVLFMTTDEAINVFREKIRPSSGLHPRTRPGWQLQRQYYLTLFAHLKMLLRVIVNFYKYHDIDAANREISGPVILSSHERKVVLERAESVKEKAKWALKRINECGRRLGLPSIPESEVRIVDDGKGYLGVRITSLFRRINSFAAMVQNQKLKRDSPALNRHSKLLTKDKIDTAFRSLHEPESFHHDADPRMTYSHLLCAAHFHGTAAKWCEYAAGFANLEADHLAQIPADVLASFRECTPDLLERAARHRVTGNTYMQEILARVNSGVVNGYKLKVMPELREYIMEECPTSDEETPTHPDMRQVGSPRYDRGSRADGRFGSRNSLMGRSDGASSSSPGNAGTSSVASDFRSRKSSLRWFRC